MRANTTLTRQVALLSIIAMAGVALSTGVAAADHQVEDTGVELSAPDAVETGEDITIEADVPENGVMGSLYIEVEMETSEGSASKLISARAGTNKEYTVSTDSLGLGGASGEATVTAKRFAGAPGDGLATETVTLEESGQEESSVPPWAQALPQWLIDFLEYWGYF